MFSPRSALSEDCVGARENITDAVNHLMAERGITTPSMATVFDVSAKYMYRKISEGRWVVDDLPLLAETFHVDAGDLLYGYQRIQSRRGIRQATKSPYEWADYHTEKEKTSG
jgi:hypothetical protein